MPILVWKRVMPCMRTHSKFLSIAIPMDDGLISLIVYIISLPTSSASLKLWYNFLALCSKTCTHFIYFLLLHDLDCSPSTLLWQVFRILRRTTLQRAFFSPEFRYPVMKHKKGYKCMEEFKQSNGQILRAVAAWNSVSLSRFGILVAVEYSTLKFLRFEC